MQRFFRTGLVTCLAIIFSLVLYGCGGGGSSGPAPVMPEPMPTVHNITLPDAPEVPEGIDYMVPAVSIAEPTTIDAGDMMTFGYVTFSCPAGGEACAVAQADDGSITSTGGEATVTVAASVTMGIAEAVRLAGLKMQVSDVAGLDTLPEGYDDLGGAGTFTVEPGESTTRGDTTYSCSGEVACVVTVNADGTATSMGGMATAMISTEAAQRKMNDEEQAAIAAATKAAGTKRKAIQAENDQTTATDAGLGGSEHVNADGTDGNADDPYGLAITRDRDGTEIKITDLGMMGDDDPKFTQAMDLGGGRTMHTRIMEADSDGDVVEEVVIVSTDIEAPKATAFAMVAGQALDARDLDDGVDADGDGTATNDYTALIVADTEAVRALIMASAFDSVANVPSKSFGFDNTATTTTDEAFEAPGTYNGASGTYRCNGTAICTVTYDTDGEITAFSTGWIFTPDSGATSDVPDGDYLHYGVWLKKTTDEDGVVEYNEVETFAGSSIEASGDVTSVLGSATYEGGATGVYEHSVKNQDGTEASATSGHFTADAELTAYFGQTVDDANTPVNEAGQIAPTLLHTISGTINNFMLSGHDQGPGWSVSLEKSNDTTSNGTETGITKGGGADGKYTATYHGPVAAVDGVVPQPHTVVGEFNAFFSNGSVAGAFGARKQAE